MHVGPLNTKGRCKKPPTFKRIENTDWWISLIATGRLAWPPFLKLKIMQEIKLTQGKIALVDDEDYEWLNQWKWFAAKIKSVTFYAVRKCYKEGKKRNVYMHRDIMGVSDRKIFVDHKNRDGLFNLRYNLREANNSQNNANRIPKKNSSSKYLGVSWNKKSDKWAVQICKNGKRHHVGYFSNEEEAAKSYNEAAIRLHGEFARLNI